MTTRAVLIGRIQDANVELPPILHLSALRSSCGCFQTCRSASCQVPRPGSLWVCHAPVQVRCILLETARSPPRLHHADPESEIEVAFSLVGPTFLMFLLVVNALTMLITAVTSYTYIMTLLFLWLLIVLSLLFWRRGWCWDSVGTWHTLLYIHFLAQCISPRFCC